jgi:HEPN domain-containing protein
MRGKDVCKSHSERRDVPSHEPPPERRCQSKAQDENGHRTRPCKLWAMKGLTVCYRHGGANKTTRAAGDRRVAEDKVEQKARRLAARFAVEAVDNPLEALAQHVAEEIGFKNALGSLVNNLRDDEIRYKDAKGAEQLRSEIVVYERALGRVGDRLVAYARLGIDERLAKIEEAKAELVIGAINAVIAFLGASGDRAAEARRVGARHLRSVS